MSKSQRPSSTHRPATQSRSLGHSPAPSSSGSKRKSAAYRQRMGGEVSLTTSFGPPENWYEPRGHGRVKYIVQPAGEGYVHPVTAKEVKERLAQLPKEFTRSLEVVQFSQMTRKRRNFPCYGMQWGMTVYLYPIEASLVETYIAPPKPAQQIEAKMFGGVWQREGNMWTLTWTPDALKDFYLNNVLIHEVGHLNDPRNSRSVDRERYANWFAIEYGYRASRGIVEKVG
ncbi:MAG: hypothetical protein U0903_13230 [Planctomycetales bacterium]